MTRCPTLARLLCIGWVATAPSSALGQAEVSEGKSRLAHAMYERRLGALEKALKLLTDAERELPSAQLLAEIYFQRGLIFSEQGNSAAALRSFIRAIEIDPARLKPGTTEPTDERIAAVLACARRAVRSFWRPPPAVGDVAIEAWQCPVPTGLAVEAPGPVSAARTLWTQTSTVGVQAPPTSALVLAGASLASLGAGVAFGVVARNQATDADASSDGQSMATAANVSYGLAATAAAAALIVWLLEE